MLDSPSEFFLLFYLCQGQRGCVGLKLSYAEAKIGILRLYQRYTFRLLPGQVRAVRSICMTASALLCVYTCAPVDVVCEITLPVQVMLRSHTRCLCICSGMERGFVAHSS